MGTSPRKIIDGDDTRRNDRGAILALAAKHGASEVRIFGSVARGDDDEASDVDVVVRLLPTASAFATVELQMDLEELLRCKVDLVTEHEWMRPHFLEELRRDAVSV